MVLLNKTDVEFIDKLINKYTILYIKNDFINAEISGDVDLREVKIGLGISNLMSTSKKYSYQMRALKFATVISNIIDSPILLKRCVNILKNLTIFTFEDVLARKKGYKDTLIQTRGVALFESLYMEEFFTKRFGNIEERINKFQLEVSNAIEYSQNISVSAPISIGKSFLMKKILIDFLLEKDGGNIIYLVPTRALINEVMNDIQKEINYQGISGRFFVSCSSEISIDKLTKRGVFVLTQERLNQLCSNIEGSFLKVDLIIIDEAQQIMHGARGVLLEYTIKRAKDIWKYAKLFFISPLIQNPQIFIDRFKLDNEYHLNEKRPSVNQNIIKLEKSSKRSRIDIKYNGILVGDFEFKKAKLKKQEDRIAYIINSFNNGENSIIYCNIQSLTRKVCNTLINTYEYPIDENPELDEFSNFLKNYICDQYDLVNLIKRGLAYHYSKLPSIIKLGIEDLASKGYLKIVACTSTLLEGINVQANNIYIFNPSKNAQPLTNLDFWNLSGRAGRMSKDICGNIICIDFGKWFEKSYAKREIEDVEFKKNLVIRNDIKKFSEFTRNKEEIVITRANKKEIETFQQVEGVLILEKIEGVNIIETYSDQGNLEEIKEVECIITDIVQKNVVPEELLKKLVGIDIKSLNNLWNLFERNTKSIQAYIPINPFGEGVNKRFKDILDIINDVFFNNTNSEKRLAAIRVVALNWMQEKSLKSILFHNFDPKQYTSKEINNRIEESISFLNDDIRFTFSKYIYAYQETLKTFLENTDRHMYIEKIPNYPLFLEFGASNKVTLELMTLGIFREGAIEVAKYIYGEDSKLIIDELKHLDLSTINMNTYIKKKLKEKIDLMI